jgi:hypothetical protein
MSDEKKPLTEEQLKKKLRNIRPENIVPADDTEVLKHEKSLDRILRAMGEIAECDWRFDTVFISDLSSVGDFLHEESELATLSTKLGVAGISRRDSLVDIAMRVEPKQ